MKKIFKKEKKITEFGGNIKLSVNIKLHGKVY
jgi:hypothetical protein